MDGGAAVGPTALLVGAGCGAQLGISICGPEVLESSRRVDIVVRDRTGTVTTRRMSLVDIVTAGRVSDVDARWRPAPLEHASEHPIAKSVAHAAADRAGGLSSVTDVTNSERARRDRCRRRHHRCGGPPGRSPAARPSVVGSAREAGWPGSFTASMG